MATQTGPTALANCFLAVARRDPARPAIVGSSFSDFSYADLEGQLGYVGDTLRDTGFTPESRVAIAVQEPARAALLAVALAAFLVAVPLDPQLGAAEIRQRLSLLDVDAVAVLAGQDSVARAVAMELGVALMEIAPADDSLRFDCHIAKQSIRPKQPGPDGAAFILQTSGTTGAPNLIPYSRSNLLATAARVRQWFGLSPEDRCLCVGPVYYSHGLKMTLLAPLLSGGTAAFPASPSRIDLQDWFSGLRPTWYSTGPTMHAAILDKLGSSGSPRLAHDLKFVVSGGSPLDGRLHGELEDRLGIPVLQHYGSSETGQVSTNRRPPGAAKAGTCGRPDADIVRIVGENGEPLPPGQRGEILVRGDTVFSGYLNAPLLNQTQFVEGWFRTGDIGEIDEDGFLVIHGRLKELINRGGEKISPVEIEAALMRHPAVAEAAAFAIPHPRLGEDVAAAVVLREDVQATSQELRDFLSENIAWFKIPRRIRFMTSLPRGNTGKIRRRLLSEVHSENK